MNKNQIKEKETLTSKLKITKKSGQVPNIVLCGGIVAYSGSKLQYCCCSGPTPF